MEVVKLKSYVKDYIWGGVKLKNYGVESDKEIIAEAWNLSFHPDGLTKTADGEILKDIVTKKDIGINAEKFNTFPMLIKFIDAAKSLSVQVHPSDDYAIKHENSLGKTEMWYIVDAEKDAGIYLGFKKDVSKEQFRSMINDGTILDSLNFIKVKKGESYFIEAGTVHAIAKGCLILEVQQNSNLTYRVYDYKRVDSSGSQRPLHIEKALQVINFHKQPAEYFQGSKGDGIMGGIEIIASCKYFTAIKSRGDFVFGKEDSFTCVVAVEGEGTINSKEFKKGDTYFIPAGKTARVEGKVTAVAAFVDSEQ